ncbi:MAG: hypothetical protein RIQ60_2845 [Pseudomonadota bacterium]
MRRGAPPVSVKLKVDPSWRAIRQLVPTLSFLLTVAWWVDHGLHGSADPLNLVGLSLTALAACALVLVCARALRRSGQHATELVTLSWDGQRWQMRAHDGDDFSAVDLHIRLDFGRWMLLSCQHEAERSGSTTRSLPSWIALTRRQQPELWHPLRCALYSPRSPPPPLHDR